MIYIKKNMWVFSKHILQCTYNFSQKNLIDTFYNILFMDEETNSNHLKIELLNLDVGGPSPGIAHIW